MTGIVQVGIAYNHYLQLTDAVRAGARVASVSAGVASGAPACSAVQQAAPSLSLACGTNVIVTPSPGWTSGSSVTVSASTTYAFSIFGIKAATVPLSSSTTERIE